MCTPIVLDNPDMNLSGVDPLKDPAATTAPATQPAGTNNPAPGPATSADTPTKDTPALAADEGRVFIPGANYPGAGGGGTSGTTAPQPAGTETMGGGGKTDTPTGADTSGPKVDPIQDQNTLLINSLTELAHKFTDTTTGILQAQTDATNALKGGFLDLNQSQKDAMTAAEQLRRNTGQASRKPNYSLSLSANRRAMSKGQSSTMLTGSRGVPTNDLALGRAQLLGGA